MSSILTLPTTQDWKPLDFEVSFHPVILIHIIPSNGANAHSFHLFFIPTKTCTLLVSTSNFSYKLLRSLTQCIANIGIAWSTANTSLLAPWILFQIPFIHTNIFFFHFPNIAGCFFFFGKKEIALRNKRRTKLQHTRVRDPPNIRQ